MASKRRDNTAWVDWLWKWVFPPIAVVILVFYVSGLPETIKAAQNEGKLGTFVATDEDCGTKDGCYYSGRFVSDDGTVTLNYVSIDSGPEAVGDRIRAQYFRDSANDTLYQLDSHYWKWQLACIVGLCLYLLGWAFVFFVPWIRDRKVLGGPRLRPHRRH